MRTSRAALTSTALGLLVAAGAVFTGPLAPDRAAATTQDAPAAAGLPDDTVFLNHPDQVHAWVAANPDDHRRPLVESRIADRPQALWFSNYEPDEVTADVAAVTGAAREAGHVPVLVSYMIPNRDCGGASAGGAPDFPAYLEWTGRFAAGLGDGTSLVVLEPDSLALTTCLDGAGRAERFAALREAADLIHAAAPQARVYFDAGHSGWHAPETIAAVLAEAGVAAHGDGIYSNVSNYHRTADETAFAEDVLNRLGDPELTAVIDTSRNGNGPDGDAWCDPPGRLVGDAPTAATGHDRIDALLWIKRPGELDGCAGPAGQFSPDMAYALAGGGSGG
ncbi:glycoside hydrolase family 6 protein [Streptomyces avicenniae]|uniref:glycoside hydrolase family 6 protein n=1 Tax=Streptomyces avicenniae TaxID=500153 RepID=UPI00069C820F|nr:glycoside hydrolase family 6 protein [Streptomyces avicenniae]